MARVAFIGLGRMGSGMAGRLLAAGHRVSVWNRSPAAAARLVARGAQPAASPAAAADGAEAIFAMVSDDEASRAVWLGPQGVLAGAPTPGAMAVECSTLSHGWVMALAGMVRAAGLRYVDAPVTGLPAAAAAGELTLLVGASDEDLAAVMPLLEPLAPRVLHFGPVGTGTAYKLVVNMIGAVQIASAAEGLALAERAGLDLGQVEAALAISQAASPQVVRNVARMVAGEHDRDIQFPGRLRHKDTAYAIQLAEALGARVPLGQRALAGLESLLAAGSGERNESSIIEVARSATSPAADGQAG